MPIEVVDEKTAAEETAAFERRKNAIEALHLLRSVIHNRNLSHALRKQAFADYLECGG